MAKKKSYLEIIEEAQRNTAQRQAEGRINFKEDSRNTRVQYSLPHYQGRSETDKTYKWEKELLGPMKFKGVRSYNDKFQTWAEQQGMTPGQADEYRKYMDFQEDSQWQEPELNKDGEIKQNQSLNYARGAYIVGNEMPELLKRSQEKKASSYAFKGQRAVEKQLEQQKAQEEAQKIQSQKDQGVKAYKENKDDRPAYAKFIDRFLLPISKGMSEVVAPGNNERMIQNDLMDGKLDNPVNQASLIDRGTETKILEGAGTIAGYVAPYGQGYKAADLALNKLPKLAGAVTNPYANRAVKGTIAGLTAESGLAATNELFNSEAKNAQDYALQIALGTAGGAILDPALFGAGKALNLKGITEGMSKDLTEQFTRNLSDAPVPKPETVPYNVMAQPPVKPSALPKEEIAQAEDDLLNAWQQRQVYEDDFVSSQLAPFRESQQQAATAEAAWQSTKQAQAEAQRIKGTFGKIIPDGSSKDGINDIPPQFRGKKGGQGDDIYKFAEDNGFSSPEEAIQYLKSLDEATKTKKKDLNPNDDGLKIQEGDWSALEEAARKSFAEGEGKTFDELIEDLMNVHKDLNTPKSNNILDDFLRNPENPEDISKLIDPTVPKNVNMPGQTRPAPTATTTPDEVVRNLENVNNSQAVDQAVDQLNPTQDRGKFLMRLDSQQHAPTDGSTLIETDPTVTTTSPIDMISNPLKRSASKHYKNYINRNHEAKVAEVQILENAGMKEAAKKVKKYGSDFDKAVGNELAAGSAAKSLVDRHSTALEEAVKPLGKDVGKNMAEAMDYQLARNLDWIRNNVDPDYELPNGWDWGRVNSVINTGIGDKYKPFTDAMYAYNQEVRDVMLDYGMITKEVHEMLGQNPYYVAMARDISQLLDNIDVGMSQRVGSRRRGSGPGIIYSLKGGDADTFIKNPLDTMVERTFTMYQNAMRNDTAQQALRLAEIDDGSLGLIKKISQKQYKEGGGLMVLRDGKREYIRLQQDLQKMLDENQSALDLGKLGRATQMFAGLKTRSLEYQSAAIVRDLGQAYLTSQIKDPIRYTREFFKSIGNKRMSAKEAGAYFDRAHNDHTGGVDPKKLLEEYQRRTGNVKSFKVNDKQSWKDFGSAIKRTIDKVDVARRLGQVTDEIPRDIEVRETERLFMKKHGAEIEDLNNQLATLNQQIEAAQNAPAFDPQSQGVDDLVMQRDGIESQLRKFKQDLRREQVYRGRDVMDYSRTGGGKTMKNIIRPWVIFANTTTQSKDKVIRSFIERPGSTTAKLVGLVGPMVALQQMNHDNMSEEEQGVYNNLPDYMKQYNYVFVNGGDVYAVPKLHELALVTNPIEAALKGEDQNEAMRLLVKELVPYQGGNIAQGLVPNADGSVTPTQNMQVPSVVFSPGIDAIANKKLGFNQKPISFGGYYGGADAEANDWTLDVFKDLMGNNPSADKTQYLIEQYLGDYGKYGNQTLNAILGRNDNKVEEALRYLNPLQDRVFLKDGTGPFGIPFRTPAQETKK